MRIGLGLPLGCVLLYHDLGFLGWPFVVVGLAIRLLRYKDRRRDEAEEGAEE